MDSDWLTGLLVVLMVTIAVGLLWSGTLFGSGHKPAPIIIETPAAAVEVKENKKKPRQRTNAQQSPKATVEDVADTKEITALTTSSSGQDVTENQPTRSPKKKKTKALKRDELTGNTNEVAEETSSTNDGTWQTQLSRQQKQELLRQRRQQESATQSSSESVSPPEDSIEKQIASAADEVVTASITDSKDDELMYLENDDDADAWLVINKENSDS